MKTLLHEGTHFVTVGLQARFLAPVKGGTVTPRARAAAVKGEERTYSAEVNVEDEGGARVAVFSSTLRLARGSAQK